MSRLRFVLLAVSIACLACSEPTEPRETVSLLPAGSFATWQWAPDGGEIVYTSGFFEKPVVIRGVNTTTGAIRIVVQPFTNGKAIDPSVLTMSGDGKYVFFFVANEPLKYPKVGSLYRARIDGAGAPELLVADHDYVASGFDALGVTYAGDRVAIPSTVRGDLLVWTASGAPFDLRNPLGGAGLLSWSPDGNTLLVVANAWFSSYDMTTSRWSSWDAQTPDFSLHLSGARVQWENGAAVVYVVQVAAAVPAPATVIVSRYDYAKRVREDIGTITLGPGARGYSWSPDRRRIAWINSYCAKPGSLQGGFVCLGSQYDFAMVSLPGGDARNVDVVSDGGWPLNAVAAFSPSGARIAFAAEPLGLRIYDVQAVP